MVIGSMRGIFMEAARAGHLAGLKERVIFGMVGGIKKAVKCVAYIYGLAPRVELSGLEVNPIC